MVGIENPKIWNVLKISWTVARGILELTIMVYVLGAILDPADTVIVAVLGIIYATIRSAACSNISRSRKWLGQVTVTPWSRGS